jgi:translation initiation factor RLI1
MEMSKKMALVDYNLCHPEKCDRGICSAAEACPSHLLHQEEAYQPPMPEPFACRACGTCVNTCPQKAIRMISG